MTLRLLNGHNRGLTARTNLIAGGFAALIVVMGGTYVWVLLQFAERQSESLAIARYREAVTEVRQAFHAVEGETLADTAGRAAVVDGWLTTLGNAQSGLPRVEAGVQGVLTSRNALERTLRALAVNFAQDEVNGALTELDLVWEETRTVQEEHARGVSSFVLRACAIGIGVVIGLLAAIVFLARNWTRQEIALPLTAICNELERTSKETVHSGEQLDMSANRVLAASTTQAEAIQETVAAMNEITAMVAQTTTRAGTSATEARAVLEKTRSGKAVVAEMNEAMQNLTQANEKLERISKIFKQISHKTTVINDIAFKTKMLSINAAVEAARAGQHGRGFSVVASEVGNLSKLSAEAANAVRALLANSQQEVTDIIETTSEQVRAGSRATSAVDQAFSEIAKAVQQVAEQAVAISQAANEQELGVKQTASGIEQIHSKMLETRGVAENTRVELRVVGEQSARLVALSGQLRKVLHGTGKGVPELLAERRSGAMEPADGRSPVEGMDDIEATALVRRLGEAAREGRAHLGPNAANDNTGRGRFAG